MPLEKRVRSLSPVPPDPASPHSTSASNPACPRLAAALCQHAAWVQSECDKLRSVLELKAESAAAVKAKASRTSDDIRGQVNQVLPSSPPSALPLPSLPPSLLWL